MAVGRVAPVPAVLTRAGARALRLVSYSISAAIGDQTEFRIDELARAAGTTTRNVRAYQERGLLPPPSKHRGRASIYDRTHLERLKIIDSLLQRKFTSAHIGGIISCLESGRDLTEVLGFEPATGEDSDDGTIRIPLDLVDNFLGVGGSQMIDKLVGLGLATANSDASTVTFTEPRLLDIFNDLHRYGLQLRELVELYESVAEAVGGIARLMVDAAKGRVAVGLSGDPRDVADNHPMAILDHMRALGVAAVNTSLHAALDDLADEAIADGAPAAALRRA